MNEVHLPIHKATERGVAEALPPYPYGWYTVAFSTEVAKGAILTRKLGGREIVVFRTEAGTIGALDPVCPHLGAHLGKGSTVVGETLRCPFHGFRFGTDGECVATGYGTKPPKTHARTWQVIEDHGVIMVWLDPAGRAPLFEVPKLDMDGFTPLRTKTYSLRGHPQDTTENSVDIGHFSVVHGYRDVTTIEELEVDGPALRARYGFFRPVGLFGEAFGGVGAEIEVHVHGLGHSYVEVTTPSVGLVFRNFVFPSPAGDMDLDLRIAVAMKRLDRTPNGLHPALRAAAKPRLARAVVERALMARAFREYCNDVEQDFVIWKHKEFVPKPALALGDGPLMRYRRWAEQFYAA